MKEKLFGVKRKVGGWYGKPGGSTLSMGCP